MYNNLYNCNSAHWGCPASHRPICVRNGGSEENATKAIMAVEPGERGRLELVDVADPQPELHIRPDPQARYETVDKVLADTKRAQTTKMGFVGNEDYADF